jgi:hypothetical protein
MFIFVHWELTLTYDSTTITQGENKVNCIIVCMQFKSYFDFGISIKGLKLPIWRSTWDDHIDYPNLCVWFYTSYGSYSHMCDGVRYPILRRMLGYTNDQQLHH